MAKIVLDTSVYIPLLQKGKSPGNILKTPESILYLSAVVAQELLAGAGDASTMDALERLMHTFKKNGRLIVPMEEDWFRCGQVLSQIGKKYGYETIKKGRLVNDVLIALGCKSIGAALITSNHKDFQLIHRFISFQFVGV